MITLWADISRAFFREMMDNFGAAVLGEVASIPEILSHLPSLCKS